MSGVMSGIAGARRFVILIFVAAACSKPPPPDISARAASGSAAAPARPVVDIRPITISFGGQPIARLFADGRTESAGPNAPGKGLIPGPTLHPDGTIAMTRPGVTARIDDKGDVYVTGAAGPGAHEQLFGHISADRFTFAGSPRPWDVRVEGNLIEFGDHDSSQIDGDVTPSMRRTALVMAAAFYIEGALARPAP
jgi:hypothetical protein